VQTNGPYGSSVRSFAVSGTDVFAGISGGVFVSADSGTNWVPGNIGVGIDGPDALAASGTNLFSGFYGEGVFLSTDRGTSWKAVNHGLTNTNVNCLVVSGANLYVGTSVGVFLSTDSGVNWERVGMTRFYVWTIAIDGTNVLAGTDEGMFVSSSNDTSWTTANTGLPYGPDGVLPSVRAFAVTPATGRRPGTNIYACTSRGVFLSANSGKGWRAASNGLPIDSYGFQSVYAIAALPAAGGTGGTYLYAGTSNGVYLSTDNGTNWRAVNIGMTEGNVYALIADGANLIAGTENGLFHSTDSARTWTILPVIGTTVECFASDSSRLFTGVGKNRVFLSTDRGATWLPMGELTAYYHIYCLAVAGPNLLAGGTCTLGRVDISSDEGMTWRRGLDTIGFPCYSRFNAESFVVRQPNVFVGGTGIWTSTDNGNSWSPRNDGLDSCSYFQALDILDTALFAGGQSGLFISNIHGGRWRAASAGMTGAYVKCLTISGKTILAGTWGNGAYRSTDFGTTWSPAKNGLRDSVVYALAASGKNVFAGTPTQGVFMSGDAGASWTAVNDGLKSMTIHALEVYGTDLYAGTAAFGVWRRPLSDLVVADTVAAGPSGPNEYRLLQNYPNPFNPSTTIKFELPRESHVNLTVYDVLGRELSRLVNERMDAGYHDVKFDGSALASGMYFYRIQAGSYVNTKKLLLLH
jgi:hypothetical protein